MEVHVNSFLRSSGGLAVAAALAACSDPAGLSTPRTGTVQNAVQVPTASQATTSNGGLTTVAPQGPLGATQPWTQPFGPQAIKVYGNLGEGSTAYRCCSGLTISGITSNVGANVATANAFVPGDNYTVTGIALAVSHVNGVNIYRVSLNSDNAGNPGAVLRAWTVANLPPFGSCCALAVVRSWSALPIAQGARYWVVASPESSDTWGAWNFNSFGAIGAISQWVNGTWRQLGSGIQGAFAVFGQVN